MEPGAATIRFPAEHTISNIGSGRRRGCGGGRSGAAVVPARQPVGWGYAVAAITVVPGVQVAAAAVLALLPKIARQEVDGPTPGVDTAHIVQGALAGVAIIVAAVLVSALAMGSCGWSLFLSTPSWWA